MGMKVEDAVEILNQVLPGWTSHNTLIVNSHPRGAIFDTNIRSKKWFVIINNSDIYGEDIDSLEEAINFYRDNHDSG
jgi:hypothetical protein